MAGRSILIIDDSGQLSRMMAAKLESNGYLVTSVANCDHLVSLMQQYAFDVILLNDTTGNGKNAEIVQTIQRHSIRAPIILLADQRMRLATMESMREHLFSYYIKPIDFEALDNSIRQAIAPSQPENSAIEPQSVTGIARRERVRREETRSAPSPTSEASIYFLGESAAMRRVREQIREVAQTDLTVLIRGESGVGKGVTARLIHQASRRAETGDMITINCATIPESLFESELFGHEMGAFTGAGALKPGLIELATGGTAFLDEIGEIPVHLQAKLLQVIEQKRFFRLGGKKPLHVDARLVAATNCLLEQMINERKFRTDLFFRLNEYTIYLPPLRERPEDIPLLIQHFIKTFGDMFNRPHLGVSSNVMSMLLKHPWPGNVRELESIIRRFVLSESEEAIAHMLRPKSPMPANGSGASLLDRGEVQTILAALNETHWHKSKAAQLLGISYSALHRRIRKYQIENVASAVAPNASPEATRKIDFAKHRL